MAAKTFSPPTVRRATAPAPAAVRAPVAAKPSVAAVGVPRFAATRAAVKPAAAIAPRSQGTGVSPVDLQQTETKSTAANAPATRASKSDSAFKPPASPARRTVSAKPDLGP